MGEKRMYAESTPNFIMNNLVPAVIQDYKSNEVLMVGYMNSDAWDLTCSKGKVHYYSRKKDRLWIKGEQSGHFQIVKQIYINCDNTAILIKVKQIKGACDLGYKSCFHRILKGEKFFESEEKVFEPIDVYKANYTENFLLGIPSGSLKKMTINTLNLSGYKINRKADRSYDLRIDNRPDIKLFIARAEELPYYVQQGILDAAITGMDMVKNADVNLRDVCDLKYNKLGLGSVAIALAVPENENIEGSKYFSGKKIATAYQKLTQQFFDENDTAVKIIPSLGATEGKVPLIADAIVELVETGETLNANGLKPVIKIFDTTAHLVVNNESWGYTWKRRKVEEIANNLVIGAKKLPKNLKKIFYSENN